MGFLTSAAATIDRALADAIEPPLPPDITRWCQENIVFDARSPMPGAFDIERFAFLREIHETLSPEHAAREVTVKGSAQWGKTVSVIQPTLGAWFEYSPLDALVVHPTQSAATEWVNNKWNPMRREAPGLIKVFGDGRGDNIDTTFNQETRNKTGSLKVASAGSPADLTGTSRRLVIMDDLAKFEMTDKGDPEALADSRASGFEDAKILRVSTTLIEGTCRITRSYARSDQRQYYVPCPHCGNHAPLTWENFKASINPERLHNAHFTCDACQKGIYHGDKERIVSQGRWVSENERGDHPGFFLWRAYAPQRDWASIAVEYARMMGWSRIEVRTEAKQDIDAESEQVFFNDVLGLAFAQASKGPSWEILRDRGEDDEQDKDPEDKIILPKGIVPAEGVLLTAGVDCQDDRIEVTVSAYGRNRKRWTIDHIILPHYIGDDVGRSALNAILKATWKTSLGLRLPLDMLAIDGGTYTDDVWSWAKTHPWSRVIVVKGSSSQNGPVLLPMKFERRKDGKAKRRQKRGFMLNVSQMKGDFYTLLTKVNPTERGYVQFPCGMPDEYYKQLASEVKTLKRQPSGTITASWDLVEPSRRNECLDCMNYSEGAARRCGWTSFTDDQWDVLEAERSKAGPDTQGDLFDGAHQPAVLDAKTEKPKKRLSERLPE